MEAFSNLQILKLLFLMSPKIIYIIKLSFLIYIVDAFPLWDDLKLVGKRENAVRTEVKPTWNANMKTRLFESV